MSDKAEGDKPLSKNALKKLEKEKLKAERKAEKQAQQDEAAVASETEDFAKDSYGDSPLINSSFKTDRKWVDVQDLVLGKKRGKCFDQREVTHLSRDRKTMFCYDQAKKLYCPRFPRSK